MPQGSELRQIPGLSSPGSVEMMQTFSDLQKRFSHVHKHTLEHLSGMTNLYRGLVLLGGVETPK